jgi:UDPglucose 6-dehydrogenase
VVEKLQRHLRTLRGRRIGLLGLAFKPGTDDLRDSPSIEIARDLLSYGAAVTAHDPVVAAVPDLPTLRIVGDAYAVAHRADAVVVATKWPQFLNIDLDELRARMRDNVLIDARNVFEPGTVVDAGFRYDSIGRPVPRLPYGSLRDDQPQAEAAIVL